RAKDFYARFRAWCEASGEASGEDIPTQRRGGEALAERGIESKTSNGTWYLGLALRSEEEEEGHGKGSWELGTLEPMFMLAALYARGIGVHSENPFQGSMNGVWDLLGEHHEAARLVRLVATTRRPLEAVVRGRQRGRGARRLTRPDGA